MKKGAMLTVLVLIVLMLTGCSSSEGLNGSYVAVNPPVESGEMVIKELAFSNGEVTMISGDVQQTVSYRLQGDTFTIVTDYGDFSYDYALREDGTLVIDGVDYRKQ